MSSARSSSSRCPVCKKTSTEKYRPFCSKRCADVDLGKWLGERYSIPAMDSDLPDLPEEFIDEPEGY